jgi:hypothetical protein
MPEDGESHYPIGVALLKATFPRAARRNHKDLVRSFTKTFKDRRVAYCDWPLVRELNERLADYEELVAYDRWERDERTRDLLEQGELMLIR